MYCKKCGNSIEKDSKYCENCGEPISSPVSANINVKNKKQLKPWQIVLLIITIILVICLICNDIDDSPKNDDKVYSIGETVSCTYFDITVDKVQIKKKGTRLDSYQVIDDPEWIGVILTVKNTDDKEHTFYGSDVDIENSNGEILDHSWLSYKIWGEEPLKSPKMSSGGTKKGYIQFSNNNQDNSKLTLIINCNDKLFAESKKYRYDISK